MTAEPTTASSPSAGKFSGKFFSHWRGWLYAAAVSCVVSLLIVSPFFFYGSASGHDFEFHAASWLDVDGQWKEGIVFPRWTEWANHGFGEPRFIFYPPFSWVLGGALSFFFSWTYVPVAFIVLVQTFAGVSAFALARRLLPERASLFGAVCYAANPNALLIIYMRSDYAELLATAFYPLLFLAALQLGGVLAARVDTDSASIGAALFGFDGAMRKSLVFFSAMFAAVWLSNAPAGVIATYSVTLFFVWVAFRARALAPAVRGFGGMALGFAFTSFYLLPAAYEQRWVNITQALSAGLLPAENFLYTATNDPEHTIFNWIASTTAIVLIVGAGLAALAARSRRGATAGRSEPRPYKDSDEHAALGGSSADSERSSQFADSSGSSGARGDLRAEFGLTDVVWQSMLVVAGAATFLMLRPTMIFWDLLPKLKFVQFPWRWMSIVGVVFAFFLAAVAARSRFRWVWVVGVALVQVGGATFFVHATWWDTDDITTLRAGVVAGSGFDGVDEYDPKGDDHYNLSLKAPQVQVLAADPDAGAAAPAGATILVERWTASEKRLHVTALGPVRVALRVLNYPAWRVEVNGARVAPENNGDTAQMVVAVPAGASDVSVVFGRTWDRTVGGIVSMVSILFGAALIPARRRRS
ncbi:MAG TPA: hypothetical protein VGJ06_14045 [Candidatus Acidoferrum sp.]|jgi:hypothetical protein